MGRTIGATNIVPFEERSSIETSSSSQVRHLSNLKESPLSHFLALLKHQDNFLNWLDTRHDELRQTKRELAALKNTQKRGPKDSVHTKYRWYAELLVLLEAINNFEVFYKRSLIMLASALRGITPPENISGNIDGSILWSIAGDISIETLLFEHQLFHDLGSVDKATTMLIGEKRYGVGKPSAPMRKRIKA